MTQFKFIHAAVMAVLGLSSLCANSALAGTRDAALIGPVGTVKMFTKEGDDIFLRVCQDHRIIETEKDCVMKPGSQIRSITATSFQFKVNRALLNWFVGGSPSRNSLSGDYEFKYSASDLAEAKTLQANYAQAIQRISAYIATGSGTYKESEKLRDWTAELKYLGQKAQDIEAYLKKVNELNLILNDIVKNTYGPDMHFYIDNERPPIERQVLTEIARNMLEDPRTIVPMAPTDGFVKIPAGVLPALNVELSPCSPKNIAGIKQRTEPVALAEFEMQSNEVTRSQFFKVLKYTTGADYYLGCPTCPASDVSFENASSYVAKLNSMQDVYTYSLPTEIQWEYAARAGAITKFHFGDDESKLSLYAVKPDNGYSKYSTMPSDVGMRKANAFGLTDVHGNVSEWTSTRYSVKTGRAYFGPVSGEPGYQANSDEYVVVSRGGGSVSTNQCHQLNVRELSSSTYTSLTTGFRVIRTLKARP